MTVDREQTRRDAEDEAQPELLRELADAVEKDRGFDTLLGRSLRRAADRVEQAERERDEWREAVMAERHRREEAETNIKRQLRLGTEQIRGERDAAEARLASVPALVEALELAVEALEAARDRGDRFGAAAWRGGIVSTLFALDAALTVYEQSQGSTE